MLHEVIVTLAGCMDGTGNPHARYAFGFAAPRGLASPLGRPFGTGHGRTHQHSAKVARNEPFEVRVQIRHPMETGYRTDDVGKSIPRNVIRNLTCRYNGELVFAAQLSSGIAANPYLRFFVTARDIGRACVRLGRRCRRARLRARAGDRRLMHCARRRRRRAGRGRRRMRSSGRLLPSALRSGITYAGADVRAMQADDDANPGLLWVQRGRCAVARTTARRATRDARTAMRGVAARYPAYDAGARSVLDLEGRIERCRTRAAGRKPAFGRESDDLLALATFVALPIARHADQRFDRGPARASFDRAAPRSIASATAR